MLDMIMILLSLAYHLSLDCDLFDSIAHTLAEAPALHFLGESFVD